MMGKLSNLCLDSKLLDSDLVMAGVQPECQVTWRLPEVDPMDPSQIIWVESPVSMPQCEPGATSGNVAMDCWQLVTDFSKWPMNGQLINVLRTAQEIQAKPRLDPGTRLHGKCHICPSTSTDPGCMY